MAATKPITFCEHLQLCSIGVQPASIGFQTLTLESDHFICVREKVIEQDQVVIIDLADSDNVLRRPITAESVIMHPRQKILALRLGRRLQVFNIETKQKLNERMNSEDIVFWKWVSDTRIGIVTDTAVYHWTIADTTSAPAKVFDRHATLAEAQIINYRISSDAKWMVLVGITSNTTDPWVFKVKGVMQLYSVELSMSLPIDGHAAAFAEMKLDGDQHPTKLITYATRTATGGKLHIAEIDCQASDPVIQKKVVDVFFPPEATGEFPVGMQVSKKHGIVFLITKFGFIHLYDLESGVCVYMNRISEETILVTAEYEAQHGIIGVNKKGQVFSVSVDERTIVPYMLGALNNIELVFKLAKRANLPGADNVYTQSISATPTVKPPSFSVSGIFSVDSKPLTVFFRSQGQSGITHALDFPIDVKMKAPTALDVLIAACKPQATGDVNGFSGRESLCYPPNLPLTSTLELASHPIMRTIRASLFPDLSSGQYLAAARDMLQIVPKGRQILPQRQQTQGKGKVAKLIITLPIRFKGGALAVHDLNGNQQKYYGRGRQPGDLEWVAFLSDCDYEVTPVTKGVRLMISYNILLEYSDSDMKNITMANHQVTEQSGSHTKSPMANRRLDKGDPSERLQQLIENLEDLNLTVKIRVLHRQSCGGCADIYIGEMKDTEGRVAVKRARFSGADDMLAFTKKVVREMRIWSQLFHENVLPFKGFIEEEGTSCPSIITDWMVNGSLKQFLRDNDEVDILFMAQGIAKGLSYLHSNNIVHGDLKADNVVVSSDGVPLIMDFGISHILISTTTAETATAANKGSLRWQARELLADEAPLDELSVMHHTKESDVWAFGMTCLEVLTRKVPYANCNDFQVGLRLHGRRLPDKPSESIGWTQIKKALWSICEMCWKWEKDERPVVDTLLLYLQGLDAVFASS